MRAFNVRSRIALWIAAVPLVAGCTSTADDLAPCPVEPYTVLATPTDGGLDGRASCVEICESAGGEAPIDCGLLDPVEASLAATCDYETPCYTGRRPNDLREHHPVASDAPLARYFAHAAYLEATSVQAFELLADELVDLGAPRWMIEAATGAADDERRHAAATTALGRRFGARRFQTPAVPQRTRRSVEAFAIENAVEGCVRETFGAFAAAWQAVHASDEHVRRAMASIADDEARHAELAWDIQAWLDGRLDDDAKERVRAAKRSAVAELFAAHRVSPEATLVRDGGALDSAQAGAALRLVDRELWSAAA